MCKAQIYARKDMEEKMKKIISIALVMLLMLALAACGGGASSGTSSGQPKKIAVLPWAMAEEFATSFVNASEEYITAKGWEFITLDPNGDWNQCVQILEDLIIQQVDGIIFTAIDGSAAGAMVDKVKEAGIPIIDYDCLSEAGNADASVACDDYLGGQMAAEQVMNALHGKEDATVILYEEDPGILTSGVRNQGFTDYLDENYPNVTYIKNRGTDNTRDGCRGWAVDMYTAYPNVDAVFAYWGDGALGAWYGLQEAGGKDVYVVGYDATDEQHALMLEQGPDSTFYASVAMFPEQFAQTCADLMEQIFAGTYQRQGPEDIVMFEPELLLAAEAEAWQK